MKLNTYMFFILYFSGEFHSVVGGLPQDVGKSFSDVQLQLLINIPFNILVRCSNITINIYVRHTNI